MDQDEIENAKLEARKAALDARRERLRAYVDIVQDIVESLPAPKTLIEAHRAIRVASSLDRTLVYLYSEPKLHARTSKAQAMSPAEKLKARCAREEAEAEFNVEPEGTVDWKAEFEKKLNRYIESQKGCQTIAQAHDDNMAPPSERPISETLAAEALESETPNSDAPISDKTVYDKSGDTTPAPNLANTEPPKRSGPSIRSLAPDWPPWPPR